MTIPGDAFAGTNQSSNKWKIGGPSAAGRVLCGRGDRHLQVEVGNEYRVTIKS